MKGILITEERYVSLLTDSEELERLNAGGVDNWEWYGDSIFQAKPDYDTVIKSIKEEASKLVKEYKEI